MKYLLAHDLGTSGNKATLFDVSGRLLASEIAVYDVFYSNETWAEQNADDWWNAVKLSTKNLIAKAGVDGTDIAAISFSGQMMGCLCIDKEGKPLRKRRYFFSESFLVVGFAEYYLLRGDKSDVAVLLITFFLTVIVDLTVAIEVGVVLAIVLFVRRVMQTSNISVLEGHHLAATEDDEVASMENTDMLDIPEGVEVYEIDGPFFFGLASKLDEIDRDLRKQGIKVRIIRMRKVPFMDSTGLNNLRSLWKRSQKENVQIILSGVNDNVLAYLNKVGFAQELGKEYIFPHIIPAVAKANELSEKR